MWNWKLMDLQLFGEGGEGGDGGGQGPSESGGQLDSPPETPGRGSVSPAPSPGERDIAAPEAAAPDPAEARRHGAIAAHFRELERQGEALKRVFPDFDLRRELRDPVFARLTAPGVGIGVEDAYYTVHRRQIQSAAMASAAASTAQKLSNAIQAGALRPQEAGTRAQAASLATFDYRTASREQREALKKQIRQAAARGEKVYPR